MNIKQSVTGYDIILNRFTKEKQSMIRRWRNDPKISQYMEYQKEISLDQQLAWFDKTNNDFNLYYIVVYNGVESGVINIKDISEDYHTGEAGIYIYEDRFLNTDISYRAHIVLFDYVFLELGLKNITSKIQETNTRACRFAAFLGSNLLESNNGYTHWNLSKEDYLNNKNRLRFINRYNKK